MVAAPRIDASNRGPTAAVPQLQLHWPITSHLKQVILGAQLSCIAYVLCPVGILYSTEGLHSTLQPQQQPSSCSDASHRCSAAGRPVHRAARSMPPPLAAAAQVADAAAGSSAGAGAAKAPSSNDLLVVGPGVLGSYLGKLWLEQYPGATVVGQTNSEANHDR
jgi:hypothetical protein